ncbi:hypothetical protein GJAV_G00081230 [Gymnothorax javanicus]|nr:hypothetical protein GJAV_G00081230 [Gymnothorax javanicus]
MPEDTPAPSSVESMEEKPCSSSSADSPVVMEEAKKLIGTGNRHLVMGDVVSAVNVFQEACGMLAEKYGDTADECAEAFFLCGKSLLELARMENTVLGNALEGVPDESSEEGEKTSNSKIESADNLDEKTRDELRVQVYDAMAEKEKTEVNGAEDKMEAEEQGGNVVQSLAKEGEGTMTESPVNGVDEISAVKDEANVVAHLEKDERGADLAASPEEKNKGCVAAPSLNEDGVPAAPLPSENKCGIPDSCENGDEVPVAQLPSKSKDDVPEASKTDVAPAQSPESVPEAPSSSLDKGTAPVTTSPKMNEGALPEAVSSSVDGGAVPVASPKDNEGAVAEAQSSSVDEDVVPMTASPKKNEGGVPLTPSKNENKVPSGPMPKKAEIAVAVVPPSDDEVKGSEDESAEKVEESHEDEGEKMDEGGEDDDDDDEDDDDDDKGEGTAEDKESEDEVGNLQLAWEMLEVAKMIYKRKGDKEDQLMAAQAHLKLGEVGAESGNYAQALDDFQECLNLQLKHLPPHSRLLAETHYHLGVTYGYTTQYAQAIQHFNSSIKVIESRLAMLQEAIDQAEGTDGAAEKKQEIEELKQLLPDIREKVEDALESQKTAGAASMAIQQTLSGASTSAFSGENGGTSSSTSQVSVAPADGAASKSASDISHLVRKKRKPEEGSPVKDSDAKKAKQEATVNGSGESASNGNGVQEKMEQDEPVNQSTAVETS